MYRKKFTHRPPPSKQASRWSGACPSRGASAGGGSWRPTSLANLQRGANRQPGGGAVSEGGAGLPHGHRGAQRLCCDTRSRECAPVSGEHTGRLGPERNCPRNSTPGPHHLEALQRVSQTKSGRNKDAVLQTARRARHGPRLRQVGGRAPDQGGYPEPLHGP